MELKDLIRAEKEVIDWGQWQQVKMPPRAFPLSRRRGGSYRLGSSYTWRAGDNRQAGAMGTSDLKQSLCRAFCDSLTVRDVPAGFAVSTAFAGLRGDPLGFYVVGPDPLGAYVVQDDGRTVPFLEAAGADLSSDTRLESLVGLLSEYDVAYDDTTGELSSVPVSADDLPMCAMKFVAVLLRIQDILMLTQERVGSTFKEDVVARLRQAIPQASITEDDAVSPALVGYEADVVLHCQGREPIALFLATREARLQEAIILKLVADYEAKVACRVVALLEESNSVGSKLRQRADNRLDAVPVFRGDEEAAIGRIQRLVTGASPIVH